MMDKYASIKSIGTLKESGLLYSYLGDKARNHHHYKYYSRLNRIESNFIQANSLFLTTGINWNDRYDFNRVNPTDSELLSFGICFSYSKSESVPMWMLYGGVEKTGAMIDLPNKLIKAIVDHTSVIELGRFNNQGFYALKKLDRGSFDINILDAIYFGSSSNGPVGSLYIRRSDEVVDCVESAIVNGDGRIIRKKLGWSYENETRLVVKVRKELLSDVDDMMQLIARIPICNYDDYDLSNRITLSPNYSGVSRDYKLSNLSLELNWDLCNSSCINKCSFQPGCNCRNIDQYEQN